MTRTFPAKGVALGAAVFTLVTLAGCSTSTETAEAEPKPTASAAFSQELHDLLPADIRESGTITVGAPYSLKPSIFTADSGEPTGVSVDMSEALAAVLGIEVEWTEAADPVTALQSGAIDVSMGFLSDSPAREAVLTMVPQFQNTSTLLVLDGSDVTDIESMCGQTLAVVSGSQQENRSKQISEEECDAEPIEVLAFAGAKDAITQVQSGRADAFVAPRMVLQGVVDSSGGAFAVTEADYADFPFAMGVTLDNGDFATALAGALQAIYDSGDYVAILEAWDVADIALTPEQIGVNAGSTDAFPVNQ